MSRASTVPESRKGRPRVAAVLGLTLLEVIRSQDLPSEILEAEDPSVTMPRRLGLSEVIERQIRFYREEVRKGRRMTDGEVQDLVRLVVRRPDADEVFYRAGWILSGVTDGDEKPPRQGWRRFLPGFVAYALARRRARRRLRKLFGRRTGGFAPGPFKLEARAHILIQSDPGGGACNFITGLCEAVIQRYAGGGLRVAHDQCQARDDARCRWSVLAAEHGREIEGIPDFLLHPEPGTS